LTIIITIIIITAVILYFLFWNIKTDNKVITLNKENKNESKIENIKTGKLIEEEIYTDESGLEYTLIQKTRKIPRRTFIKATLNGKYYGNIDNQYSNQFEHSIFFDFNIYEVSLKNAIYENTHLHVKQDSKIPREKLPKLLHTFLEKDGKEYAIKLYEPILANVKFDRKLHQNEGNEVFGTINAVVSGYILDFTKEVYFEKDYIVPLAEIETISKAEKTIFDKTNIPTGKVEQNNYYERSEYFYSDYKQTYWEEWKYTKHANKINNGGCLSLVIGVLVGVFSITLFLLFLPQMAFFLLLFFILFLLYLFTTKLFRWLFPTVSILILFGFIFNLFYFSNNKISPKPKLVIEDRPEEQITQTEPIIFTVDKNSINDTIIKHFRVWNDYEGNQYEGTIWTKKSDYTNSKFFKNNLVLNSKSTRAYDEMIYSLKENDRNNLNGVYQLFDIIRQKKQLSNVKFAELIVSFVQDIPYTIIIPNDCNPNLYQDKFIREYLSQKDARCDGFEKFGINSPVEFMSTLNGDCDTRTLFLYTLLAHYGYDVALLSSEYYAHSYIGINLPISGISYKFRNQSYVLWETTAPNFRAGHLPKENSNLNYWRISLISK
jgi:hypothetical protein